MKSAISIFFYDGDCGFCNKTVMFFLNRTPDSFRFCSLQSNFAKETLEKYGIEHINLDTAYLLVGDKIYQKSSAILKSLTFINIVYKTIGNILLLIPIEQRDKAYEEIAKKRLKISSSNCRILNKVERSRFIYMKRN